MRKRLREGLLADREIEIEVAEAKPSMEIMGPAGMEEMTEQLRGMFANLGGVKKKPRKMKIAEAQKILIDEEAAKLVNDDDVKASALANAEQNGIVFIDEIDKVTSRSETQGADVSRQGVQRDLLPLVEGTTVNTKYGMVKTDHILFIASGAFHLTKPSDLIPELQGRFPIRVELGSLSVDDFEAILTQTHASLVKQYKLLLATEGVTLELAPDAIRRVAQIAFDVNERTENIGARRLSTVMERLLDEVSFDAPNRAGQTVRLDGARGRRQALRPGEERGPLALHPVAASERARGPATPRVGVLAQSASRFDCSCSRPSKISVSTVSKGRSLIDCELDRGAAAHEERRLLAAALAGACGACARPRRRSHRRRRSSARRWCWSGTRPPRRSAPSAPPCPSRARAASGRSRAGSGRRGSCPRCRGRRR